MTAPAVAIARRIRAFNPAPGATGVLGGETVKVWAASVVDGGAGAVAVPGPAGQVLAVDGTGIRVCTGEGVLCLTGLQRAGGKRLPVADFLRGFAVEPGQQFQLAPVPGAAG